MKKSLSFERAIARYIASIWKRNGKNAKSIWMGISIVLLLMVFANSLKARKYSYAQISNTQQAIEKAITAGDYALAQKLYEACKQEACLLLYERVYPLETATKKIDSLENKLKTYPGNLDIYTLLEVIYRQVGKIDLADYYLRQIKQLDPSR